jgi:predicted metalloprotease with PDZ domain
MEASSSAQPRLRRSSIRRFIQGGSLNSGTCNPAARTLFAWMRLRTAPTISPSLRKNWTECARWVDQTQSLFGPGHFEHYDLLVSLSDLLPNDGGLEHLQSSEVNLPADYFLHNEQYLSMQDLAAHKYIHSWNGMYRRPAGLWTPNLNTPMRDDLLWVYEGQTEFWALVVATRAGQLTPAQALDILALDAAVAQACVGRSWKSLEDSNNDPLYDAGHPVLWRDWQRREDYYGEGVLLWLDVDTLLEERTSGKKSLADFVRVFFGGGKSNTASQTYTFGDLCVALNQVAPLDWQRFLQTRLEAHDDTYLLDGLKRAGYRLVFTAEPSEAFRQQESEDGSTDLSWSIGLTSTPTGTVKAVTWLGPACMAGISIGAQIKRVNGAILQPGSSQGCGDEYNQQPIAVGHYGRWSTFDCLFGIP